MFEIKKKYETSSNLEQNGVLVTLPSGAKVKLARWGNSNFQNELEKLFVDYPDVDNMTIEENRQLMDKYVISKTILLGWSDFAEDGNLIAYSHEKACEYLKMRDFRDEVIEESKSRDRYLSINEKKAESDLKKP